MKFMHISEFESQKYYRENEHIVPHVLCHSSPETATIADLLAFEPNAAEDFQNISLEYTENQGNPALRQEIARLHEKIDGSNVLVTSGGSEGIYLVMMSLLQPSDHVIAQFPLFQSLYELADAKGCDVSRWKMNFKRNWELDVDNLEKMIRPNTKLIVINVPHNPTGYTPSQETFERIVQIANRHNVYLFSDESHRFLVHDGNHRLPAAADLYDKAITLGSMSKSFGLPGLRVGWLATQDKNLLHECLSLKDYTTSCGSAPSEFLATLSLRHKDKLLPRIIKIMKGNLAILEEFFENHRDVFSWVPPKAGNVCFPKILFKAQDFCNTIRKKTGILLLPGSVYHYSNDYFRIGFGRTNMPETLGLFNDYISKMKQTSGDPSPIKKSLKHIPIIIVTIPKCMRLS